MKWKIPFIEANNSVTITYTAEMDSNLPETDNDVLTNIANIDKYYGLENRDNNQYREYSGNSDEVKVKVRGISDLGINKSVNKILVAVNHPVTYILKATNYGISKSFNTIIDDVLPAGLTFNSASSGCNYNSGHVICNLGTLNVDESKTVTITVTPTTLGNKLNTASINSDSLDSNPNNNNSDNASITVVDYATDLSLDKSVDYYQIGLGHKANFTIKIKNNGPLKANNVKVEDVIPNGLQFVSASSECNYNTTNKKVTCQLNQLEVDDSYEFEIKVKAKSRGLKTNTAKVSANEPETNTDNNSDDAKVKVVNNAKIKVEKEALNSVLDAGNATYFRIAVTNTSNQDAYNLVVCDTPSSQWKVMNTYNGVYSNGKICWTIKKLKAGETKVFKLKLCLSIKAKKQATNSVKVTSSNAKTVKDKKTVNVIEHAALPNGDWLDVNKVETQVDLYSNETKTVILTCPNNYIVTDGMIRLDSIDGNDYNSIEILSSKSLDKNNFEIIVRNNSDNHAQLKAFAVCLPNQINNKPIEVSNIKTQTVNVNGEKTVTLNCKAGETPITPGYEIIDGSVVLYKSEPLSENKWQLGFRGNAKVKFSIRCLNNNVDNKASLIFNHKVNEIEIQPGETVNAQVICGDQEKGIVASYELEDGLILLGHDPQPKTRVFRIHNPTNQVLKAKIDLTCINNRLGPKATCKCNVNKNLIKKFFDVYKKD